MPARRLTHWTLRKGHIMGEKVTENNGKNCGPGRLWLNSWAGRTSKRVEVFGETPKRYWVRLLEDVPLKGWRAGSARLVPKYAVTLDAQDV